MYHAIVERKLRSIFANINARNTAPMLDSLSDKFSYRFKGDTCLGGERRTRDATAQWWQRIFRLFPEARFEVDDVLVKGWPWATTIATRLTLRARLADDPNYENHVMQFMTMRWGKVTRIVTIEDSLKCKSALDRMAARGITEALAPPILDQAVAA